MYNGHPVDSEKVAVVQMFMQRWLLFSVYSFKIAISFGRLGLKLAIVDRWPLFRGGC
jgi:hypothetical protein